MNKLIEKQFIQGNPLSECYQTTLDTIDYDALYWGFKRNYATDNFFQEKQIYFSESLTDQEYTSDHLLYYPGLAKQFRQLQAFPILKKTYPVDMDMTGTAFLFYLAHYAKECQQDFNTLKLAETQKINHLIQIYGYDRYLPIIQKLESEKEEYRVLKSVTINGVKWYDGEQTRDKPLLEKIHFRKLLNISNHYRYVYIDSVLVNTPFIAIKCCTHTPNKGHVFWYNLATLEKTSKAVAQAWKKPTW